MTRNRVVVLALDAANPELLRRWSHAGVLPNLRSLMARGLTGPIRGLEGYYIGSTWPSFYTGVNPARHGFHYQTQLVPGSYRLRSVAGGEPTRQAPFWRSLGQAGRRVAILDVPLTRLDAEVNGVQVVEWGVHDDLYGFGAAPSNLERTLLDVYGRHLVGGACDAVTRTADGYRDFTNRLKKSIATKTQLTRTVAAREPWDLLVQVFSESHCIGHQCWHLHDPTHPAHALACDFVDCDPVLEIYRALDVAVGELTRDLKDEVLIVLSAHGMTHWHGAHFLLKDILCRIGAIVALPVPAAGQSASSLVAIATRVGQRLPTAVRKNLMALRDRWRRTPAASEQSIATGVDAAASRCFIVNNGLGTSGIRLNVAGREPSGVLRPGDEADAFVRELVSELTALTHADTGRPVVSRVLRTKDVYSGPALDVLPDLVVQWSREPAVGSVIVGGGAGAKVRVRHPRAGIVEGINHYGRTGEHEPDGLFIAVGPAIASGVMDRPVSILDFAPTICRLLDHPYETGDGVRIREVVSDS